MLQFLGCFVKCFYFIWSKTIITSSCQKCPGEGACVVVPARWAVSMAKVGIGIATRWIVNGNVMASTESRSRRRAVVYGVDIVVAIIPCLRQFHRRPSWLVYQREKECLGIISILAAVTCWGKWKELAIQRLCSKIGFIQTRKYTDSTLTPLAKISNSW